MTKKRIAILIIITLLAPILFNLIPGINTLTAKEVSAASNQAKLVSTNLKVGINSSPQYIQIDNYNSSAKYTYKSANTKVAKVNEYGYIYGQSIGKTKIEVKEDLDGVITKLGTVSVSVVDAYLDKEMKVGLNGTSYVNINYSNMDATYTFKSSNSKIVKVTSYGSVSGVKLGNATITVTQKLKGKTKKLGVVKVKVVNSAIEQKSIDVPVTDYTYMYIPISYYNEKATYKYKSANTKVAKVDEYGYVTGVKKGSTTISVTETYNKKTFKIGTITVKVVGASLDKEVSSIDLGVNTSNYLLDMVSIYYKGSNAYYYAESEDSSIVKAEDIDEEGFKYCKLTAVAVGKTNLTIYEQVNDKKAKLGTVTVNVKEYPVTAFNLYDGYSSLTIDLNDSWYSMKDYLSYEPYNTTTPITFSSSDNTIVTIDEKGRIIPVAAGKATLTATCGTFTVTMNVEITVITTTSLSFDDSYFDYDSNTNGPSATYYLGSDYSYYSLKDYLIRVPYDASDKLIFTSSDETIVKVDENGYVVPVAKGNAVITVKCGELSTKLQIVVREEE